MSSMLTINGKDYDVDDLTLDEVEAIEEACGDALESLDLRRAKVMKIVIHTLLKRDNPDLTLEEVGAIKVVSLDAPSTEGSSENGAGD